MYALSSQELLHIWEVGLGQHPLDRALTILASALPDAPYEHLALLSVGQRDECLFAVRERIFGSRLVSFVVCPACQGQLELMLDMADLHIAPDITPQGKVQVIQQMNSDGYELQFRLPDSLDLAAIAGCKDVGAARNLLAKRCILRAMQGGVEVAVETIPEIMIAALAAQMDRSDPLAALDIGLDCSICGSHVQVLFDIVAFFWTEITAHAKRLLLDVHTLARAYGWREADILSMSFARRQYYLEMVT
jgi:hypothetical protein